MMQILKIDNPKGFVKADLTQVNKILKGSEFIAKRKGKNQLAIYCTRAVILSTDGMFEYVLDLISSQFKPLNL